jgi:hypothetical protein
MAKSPTNRPASADAVRRELKGIRIELQDGETKTNPAPRPSRPRPAAKKPSPPPSAPMTAVTVPIAPTTVRPTTASEITPTDPALQPRRFPWVATGVGALLVAAVAAFALRGGEAPPKVPAPVPLAKEEPPQPKVDPPQLKVDAPPPVKPVLAPAKAEPPPVKPVLAPAKVDSPKVAANTTPARAEPAKPHVPEGPSREDLVAALSHAMKLAHATPMAPQLIERINTRLRDQITRAQSPADRLAAQRDIREFERGLAGEQ